LGHTVARREGHKFAAIKRRRVNVNSNEQGGHGTAKTLHG
jgi:hypothetical protein